MPVPATATPFVANDDEDDITQVSHLWDAYLDRYYQLRRAGHPLHDSAFKGHIEGLIATDADEDAAIRLLQLTREETDTNLSHLIDAFTRGDCWTLTLHLCRTYQHMTPYVLESDEGEWVHTLAHDDRTGLYVDIHGPQTLNQVFDQWDHIPEWEDLTPLTHSVSLAIGTFTHHMKRAFTTPVTEAIDHLARLGWQPPAKRATTPH